MRASRLPRVGQPSGSPSPDPAALPEGARLSTARARRATASIAVARRHAHPRSSPAARIGDARGSVWAPISKPVKFLVGVTATAAITIGANALNGWLNSNKRLFAIGACKAKVSPMTLDKGSLAYVGRAQIDAELGALVRHPRKTIVITMGPRGAGKTTAVAHALERIDGALLVPLASGMPPSDSSIFAAILKKATGRPLPSAAAMDQEELVTCLEAAACRYGKKHPEADGWKPTLVLELETLAEPALVRVALQTIKGLVWDRGACNGFIVLSDAHSLYSLTSDRGRHTYSWVGDFEPAEADAYLDEIGALTAPEERALRADVYANASTRAIDLAELSAGLNATTDVPVRNVVRAFILEVQERASTRVNNLIGVAIESAELKHGKRGLHLIRLMKAMLEHGGSVPVRSARAYMCPNVDIADVLKQLEHHAIMINPVTGMIVFNTPADRLAAEQLLGEYDSFDDGFGPMPMPPMA
jgi:hypothetical protein